MLINSISSADKGLLVIGYKKIDQQSGLNKYFPKGLPLVVPFGLFINGFGRIALKNIEIGAEVLDNVEVLSSYNPDDTSLSLSFNPVVRTLNLKFDIFLHDLIAPSGFNKASAVKTLRIAENLLYTQISSALEGLGKNTVLALQNAERLKTKKDLEDNIGQLLVDNSISFYSVRGVYLNFFYQNHKITQDLSTSKVELELNLKDLTPPKQESKSTPQKLNAEFGSWIIK